MARRFYFTSDNHPDGENPCSDHIGNIRGARTIAQRVANELGEVVYINDCNTNNIEDCVYPDEATEAFDTEPTTEVTVPDKATTENPNEPQQLNGIKRGTEIKTLYDYLISPEREHGEEVTVWDIDYDIECYFYVPDSIDTCDDWDKAMLQIAQKLEIVDEDKSGITVNLTDVIERNLNSTAFKKLFKVCSINRIMNDMGNIFAGYVSEQWLTDFAKTLV